MDNLNTRGNVSSKPRRTRGTPSYKIRNYFAYAVLAFGGLCGYLYHQWPEAQKFKKSLEEGKFNFSGPERENYFLKSISRKSFSFYVEDEPEEKAGENPHVNPREKISSYFSSSLNEIASQRNSEELFLSTIESQYGQKFSSEINPTNETKTKPSKVLEKEATSTDDNDFAESKIIKPAKVFEIKSEKVKRKRTRNNNDLKKFIKDFGPSCSDTNQEHLQLAYAMSKSLEDYENPGQSTDSQENAEFESPYPSTQQKIATVKSTLDQFGFKTNRSPFEITTLKNNANQKKFKYLTPTLFLRTEEDRARLIETKVSRIFDNIAVYNKNLEQNNPRDDNNKEEFIDNKPRSFLLRDYYDENSTIFRKNHLELSEMNEKTFYNNTVPTEIIKTGVLLKDWCSIPGRERSPPPLPINIIVEETEDILCDSNEKQENAKENEKQNNAEVSEINKLGLNATIDHCISPDLFSDSDSELSIKKPLKHPEKSPINKNIPISLHTSPIIHQMHNSNKETSPIILLSSSNSNKIQNSPALSEKEIFSDDSDAKSLSLLDNISPRRNKNKSPKKTPNSPFKKSLFGVNKTKSESLLDIEGVTVLKNTKSDKSSSKNSSPFETLQTESQICHYESFCDNSNECFDLTRSSDESSDNYNVKIVIQDNKINEAQMSENLFASEQILTEMGAHDDNYSVVTQLRKDFPPVKDNEELIDLTQSSNEANDVTIKKNTVDDDVTNKTNQIVNNIDDFEKINTFSLQNLQSNNLEKENSNDSIKTVLLINNNSSDIIEATEEINTVPLQNKILDLKTAFEEDYSPEFDLLNPSNNQDFYKSLSFISDTESESDKSPKKKTSPTKISFVKPDLNLNKSINNKESTPKLSRRSFSENIIGDKEISFFKLTSPLSITNFISQPTCKYNFMTDENMEISDEELNYSVNKSKKSKNINDISSSFNDSKIDDEDELISSINKSKLENKIEPSCSKNLDNNSEDEAQLSQASIDTCSDISDEELNYSTNVSFSKRKLNKDYLEDLPQVMDFHDLPEPGFERTRPSLNINGSIMSEVLKHPRVTDLSTPIKLNQRGDSSDEVLKQTNTPKIDENNMKTPENSKVNSAVITPMSDYIIKKTNVTPMPNYNEMDSPELIKELDKFGVKPLKRAKGIKLLQYIYNSTHPILQNSEKIRESSSEEEDRVIKRRKKSSEANIKKRLSDHFECDDTVECLGNEIANSEKVEDMIFERKQSVRIASCRLPLHIAWHNLLSNNQELHEKILLYEPIQVEEIYAKFKSFGYKFHIQDIISFLDKKCVTIRVAQNNQKKKAGTGS